MRETMLTGGVYAVGNRPKMRGGMAGATATLAATVRWAEGEPSGRSPARDKASGTT
jgi:hypothetical protein